MLYQSTYQQSKRGELVIVAETRGEKKEKKKNEKQIIKSNSFSQNKK